MVEVKAMKLEESFEALGEAESGVATLQASEGQNLNFAVPAERILQLRVNDVQSFSTHAAEAQKNKRSAAERLYSQGLAQLSRDDYNRAVGLFA